MGPMIAAAVLPVREDHARFAERADHLAVEAFLAEAAVEAFAYPFRQGWPGSMHRASIPFSASQPWMALAMSSGPLPERMHSGAPCSRIASCSRASASEALIARSAWMQWRWRAHSPIRSKARAEPLPPPARAARRHLQPLLPADALDQLLVRAVAKRRMLPRKADDLRLQQALPLGLGLRAIAERRAADPQPPANGSPGTRQRGLDLRRNPAPALRAQRFFPSAISRALVLSSWSASSFLSSVFSFSRSRRR